MRSGMLTPCVLLLCIALLGAFDVFFFHRHTCHLSERAESRVEAWIHVARGAVYALQLSLVPNVRFEGRAYAVFVALFVADVVIAVADILVEPASRRGIGGLPPGEYLMHIVLSVLVGAMLHALIAATWGWPSLPTAIRVVPAAPAALRMALGALALGCVLESGVAALELAAPRFLFRPRPLHVTIRLRATLADVWRVTQDHVLHPTWDYRFSRITMLSDEIRTGTRMLYEKRILGVTIAGWGRYKLHAPMRQSTFEFGSDDARSLIRRGVGLWRYVPLEDGIIEFRTSYDYEVRWGVIGRLIDALLFRPLMQRETERSFARLARVHFPGAAVSKVGGRAGRRRIVPEALAA
jgi:hypothetical protein